jgi:MraZ protein
MFVGQYDHNLDDKGRLTIPAGYRDLLASGAYVSLGFEDNLMIWREDSFTSLYHKVEEKPYSDETARNFGRFLFANAVFVEMDKAGRILIPQFMRDAIGLDGQVKLAGSGRYIEVWTPEKFKENQEIFQDGKKRAAYFQNLGV